MVRYQYQGTPTTPPAPTVTVTSGSVTSGYAGTKSIWLQYRNRSGYSLVSARVQVTIAAGQGLSVIIPEAALPDPSGVCIWEYVILMSNDTSVLNACVVATVPGYDSDEETVLSPPFTISLTADEHFKLSQTVGTIAALPSSNRKHGMRRYVDETAKILEWDSIASTWSEVKPQLFNTYVSSITGTYGANTDLSLVSDDTIVYPSYNMASGSVSKTVGFWLVNDGSQAIDQGTRIGLTIENGDADVSYTTGIVGGVKLIFRGYVDVATGVLDTIGSDGVNPMDDIGVIVPYQGKRTGLILPKDLESGKAYWVDVYAELTPELLNNRITQGSSLKVSVYFYSDFSSWNPSGSIFGDFIAADGGKRRIIPTDGLSAIALPGSGNLTLESGGSLCFNNVGEQSVTGFIANQANQPVWVGVDGTCLTQALQPNGTRKRAIVGTVNGAGFATAWAGSLSLSGSTLITLTVNYPDRVRSDYPDVIAGASATLNASFVRIYVRLTAGGSILQFESPVVPGASQSFTIGSTAGTSIGSTLPTPSNIDFGLFSPLSYTLGTTIGDSGFASGTYEVAIAFRYSNTITSISHSSLSGCIFEAGVTLAESFDRSKYYGQPVADLTDISRDDITAWESRIDTSTGSRYLFNPSSLVGVKPDDQSSGTPGRWVLESLSLQDVINQILIYGGD